MVTDAEDHFWLFGGLASISLMDEFGAVTNSSVGVTNDIWFSTNRGTNWVQLPASSPYWSARSGHTAIYDHQHRFILMGGRAQDDTPNNEVWISTNGTNWTMTTTTPGWQPRHSHAVVLDNKSKSSIYLYGGRGMSTNEVYGDLWQSIDGGQSWTEVTISGGLPKRYDHAMVLDDRGRLVISGGIDEEGVRHSAVIIVEGL